MPDDAQAPGWYGKLPSLGDFAQRRLPPDFVEAWDAWLARELARWQAQAPETWLDRYLSGPSWRFLLLPGAVDGLDAAWAGVLMPSVDRVARYFPLSVFWPLAAVPASGAALRRLFGQLHDLDDLALDAMQDDWPLDRFEDELLAWAARQGAEPSAPPPAALPPLGEAGRSQPLAPAPDLAAGLADASLAAQLRAWTGGVLWWSASRPEAPRLWLSHGLPADDDFVALFDPPAP